MGVGMVVPGCIRSWCFIKYNANNAIPTKVAREVHSNMFKTVDTRLIKVLDRLVTGKLQLPDFQRKWIWNDEHIRDLLHSVIRTFPIGTLLEINSDGQLDLQHKPFDGTQGQDSVLPTSLLLDGQQRLTTLHYSLKLDGPVPTKDGSKLHRYYIDMQRAVAGNIRDTAVVLSVPEPRPQERDEESPESPSEDEVRVALFNQHQIPTSSLLEPDQWLGDYEDYWESNDEQHPFGNVYKFTAIFRKIVTTPLDFYEVPVTTIDEDADLESVCSIFKILNMGGVKLDDFELLTAMMAAQGLRLRDDWEERESRLTSEYPVLSEISGMRFLEVVSLLATSERAKVRSTRDSRISGNDGIGCTGADILSITREEYERHADIAEQGFRSAAQFLQQQCVFAGRRDLPYMAQLVSMAAIYGTIGKKQLGHNEASRLEHWFWSGIFSEAYSSSKFSRHVRDLQEVPVHVTDGRPCRLIEDAVFTAERLLELRTRGAAAYKGMMALQLKSGTIDWKTGHKIDIDRCAEEKIDVHHIFPVKWCGENLPRNAESLSSVKDIYNCVINRTPLSASTNRLISKAAPSEYLKMLEKENRDIDRAVQLSRVNISHLRDDAFGKFFVARGAELMGLVGTAMGRRLDPGEEVFRNALSRAGLDS